MVCIPKRSLRHKALFDKSDPIQDVRWFHEVIHYFLVRTVECVCVLEMNVTVFSFGDLI